MTGLPKEPFGAQGIRRFGYEILQASHSVMNLLYVAMQSYCMDLHAQSMDCPSQIAIYSYFAQLYVTIYRFVAQSMDCPPGTLRKLWIKQTRFCFVLRLLLISSHAKPASYIVAS